MKKPLKSEAYPLRGVLKVVGKSFKTKLRPVTREYVIKITYFDGASITRDDMKNDSYWNVFNYTRNLFFTDLSIKHIAMITNHKGLKNFKIILQHKR